MAFLTRNKVYLAMGAVAALAGAFLWKKSQDSSTLSHVGNRYAQKGSLTDTQYAVFFELLDGSGNLISIRRAGAVALPASGAVLIYSGKMPDAAASISRVFGPAGVAPATADQASAIDKTILDYFAHGGGAS